MPIPLAAAAAATSFGRSLGESAASTGSTGLINGFLGQLFGGMNARRQWRFQKKQMKLQQQYALEQMQKQSELSYANWQKQFDYENAYNDPTKVFDRYLKAGVTPAAVLGSSGVGVNATMSGSSAPMPSASGPSGGAPIALVVLRLLTLLLLRRICWHVLRLIATTLPLIAITLRLNS